MESSVYETINQVMDHSFTKKSNLLQRSKNTNKYPCPNCGKTYNWKTNLSRHISVECGKEPKFYCKFCDFKTKHKSTLLSHLFNKHKHVECA